MLIMSIIVTALTLMVLYASMCIWCYTDRLNKAIRKAKRATDAATLREQKAYETVADLMKRCYRKKKIYTHPLPGENGTQGSAQLRSARKKERHEYVLTDRHYAPTIGDTESEEERRRFLEEDSE